MRWFFFLFFFIDEGRDPVTQRTSVTGILASEGSKIHRPIVCV